MILRFTTIKGIGRFKDCSIGARHFSKNTIIFGQNTGGKSTLTDILWSLKTGNAAYIEGRKTFGYIGNQQVELFEGDNNSFQFPSSQWNNGFENIEIFDTQYIHENIFEGNEINFGHQRNLHTIIIGSKGKRLAEEINTLQTDFEELTKKKTAKTNEFNRIFKREISVSDFRRLIKYEDVDEKIKQIQTTIETANNQTKIKTIFQSIDTQLDNILNQNTKSILSESIQVKAELVASHILKAWKNPNSSKDFLQTGMELTMDEQENCVFCGQELKEDAKDLLKAYSQLFSNEYRKLQGDISTAVSKFEKWNPLSILESIQDKLTSINLSILIDDVWKQKIKDLKEAVNSEFSNKAKDIGYEIDFENYNELIQISNQVKLQIDELKKMHIFSSEVNIQNLKSKIKELEFSKTRHTPEWDDFLNEYGDIDNIQEEKRVKREKLREELNEHSEKLFSIHLDTINKTLEELNADFTICDFQPIKRLVGERERIFALTFFKCYRVSIDESSSNKSNFKNTLSESDKRVLAFAFFYSSMIHDEKLNDKVIIFDDPFSSFDSDRRTKTTELLANPHLITPDGELIEKTLNQLIVLTHEAEFFKWIFKKLDCPKALRIIGNGIDANGIKTSTITDCDVYKEFIEHENKRDLKEIHKISQSHAPITDYDGLCAKCRKILESIFTRKYLFEMQDEISQNKSIRSFTNKLKELAINGFDNEPKYKAFIFLCDNLNIELHDSPFRNDGGNAKTILVEFLKLIKQI
ncbi:MAG: AAA family ATPase [Bacteroidia bacterium]